MNIARFELGVPEWLPLGDKVGRLPLGDILGGGSYGEVYQAFIGR